MRLFTALELNPKVIAHMTELVRRLRPFADVAWVHPQNMHVTLKYIGDWRPHRLEELIRALNRVELNMDLTVQLAGLGFFPHARDPRVFWAGAENTPALRQLASRVDAEVHPLGIAPEVRPYQPHVTLGRIRERQPLEDFHSAIEELPSREFGAISPDRFVLFESTITPTGAIYRRLAEFPFGAPETADAATLAGAVFATRG